MFVLMLDDQEKRARRIDEATSDWLESQVFPTTPLVRRRGTFQHRDGYVSPLKQAIEIEDVLSLFSTDRMAA